MSIAAAENEGLGPCNTPHIWVPNTTNTNSSSIIANSKVGAVLSTFPQTAKTNNIDPNGIRPNKNSTSTASSYTSSESCSTSTTTTIKNLIYKIPHKSPIAATAAVTVSTVGTDNVVTASLGGLEPSVLVGGDPNFLLSPTIPRRGGIISDKVTKLQKAVTAVSLTSTLQSSITMNAVASPISNNSAAPTRKIRRKTDPKANLPQSQINKCNNEKRRRELENNYIEQLSEFLQLNKRGDMTSTKPDKAAILNQVVKTYREFCDKGQCRDIPSSTSRNPATATNAGQSNNNNNNNQNSISTFNNNKNKSHTASTRCSRCATDNCSIHPVQQGEISSTEPPLPEPTLLNGQVPEISAYFEALEHYLSSVDWVLLQVTADGIIESCTQNIRELIGYEKQELHRKPLYQYLYPGDHAKLEPIINMSYSGSTNTVGSVAASGSQSGWIDLDDGSSAASSQHSTTSVGPTGLKAKRNVAAKVRMLVKDLRSATQTSANTFMANANDTVDKKNVRQQAHSEKYEEVMLLATPMKDDGDSSSSILCLITRPEDETPVQQMQPQSIEHLTFKLDVHGKILNLDATALREPYRQYLSSWLGRLLQDLCHPQDLNALKTHLHEVKESAATVNLMNSPAAQSPGGTPATLINPPIANVMSLPFRLRLGGPDVYVHVKANSRLFLNQSQTEGDYIMSLQTILNPDLDISEGSAVININNSGSGCIIPPSGISAISPNSTLVSPLSLPIDSIVNNNSCSSSTASVLVGVSGNTHLLGGLVGGGGMPPHNTQTTNVGGPLMTSAVINGTGNSVQRSSTVAATSNAPSNNSNIVNSFAASPAGPEANIFYSGADPFDFDLAHSSFEMDATGWTDSRPNSRASVTTPVSTPRPPSTGHGFSPAVCASPSTPYQLSSHSAASLPSPQSNASQPSTAGPGGGQFGFGFPTFDTSERKNDKDHMNTSCKSNASVGNKNTGQQGVQTSAGSSTLSSGGNILNGGKSLLAAVGGVGQPHTQLTTPQPESERLRHLLTNKSNPMPPSMHPIESDKDHHNMRHKFYNQGLLSTDDDKDGGGAGGSNRGTSGMFKMGVVGLTGARLFGGSTLPKSANTSNPMLLSLLNEKSEDDDGKGPPLGRQSELMRQLQKDDGHYGHSHGHGHGPHHSKDMSQEDLLKSLKYQGDPTTRKRSLNEPDDGISAKRENDRPSKLRENNKMLASLLENPPKNPIVTVPPQIKTIPDIAPTTSRVSSTLGGIGVSTPNSLGTLTSKSGAVTTASPSNTSSSGRGNSLRKQFSDAYLTLQQQQQQQCLSNLQRLQQQHPPQQSQPQMNFSPDAFVTPPLTTATSGTSVLTSSSATSQSNVHLAPLSGTDGDSELSKILDSVMDYVPDDGPFVSAPTAMSGLTQQEINERMAISAIQNSLMVETSQLQQQQHHQQQSQPPAYPGNMISSSGNNGSVGGTGLTHQQQQHQLQLHQHLQMLQRQQSSISGGPQPSQVQQMLEVLRVNANQGFQRPPPMYTAARNRGPMNVITTPGGAVLPSQQQYRLRQQQQQQKERLLQQQQKQQLLVPESATARTDQLCLNPNINSIGSLLNNTVAPNVALSRTNLPPDSQLSPSFGQSLLQQQQQISPGQRNTPFSPQPNAGFGSQFQSGQRLSPHQPQHLSQQQQQMNVQQQQQIAFQTSQTASGNLATQLSPRQPLFGGPGGAGGVQSPGNMPSTSSQQWSTSGNAIGASGSQLSSNTPSQRGHSLQQHNPMLSAQLQQGISPYTARSYQNQRRSLHSPNSGGVPGSTAGSGIGTNVGLQRQSSFQGGETAGFSGTASSPSPQSPYGGPGTSMFPQQQMQQRMQRQNSVPQTTQQLSGGTATNSSDFVKQELRAVVSVRAQQQAAAAGGASTSAGGNGVPGGGGGNGNGVPVGSGSLRISNTPQSPLSNHGLNTTNSLAAGAASSSNQTSLLNTPPETAMSFNFDTQNFFGGSTTR